MMILLAEFSVIQPEIGMIFWTTLVFLLVWLVLGRIAFKPIAQALKAREASIEEALKSAEKARQEMANLTSKNEALLKEAQQERASILKEAKEAKERMITEAREKAKEEAAKIMASASKEIENQKMAAITEMKNQAGILAIQVAEKIMKQQLSKDKAQEAYVASLVNEIKLN